MKIVAAILEQPVIEKILTHLGLQARAPPRSAARGQALQAEPGHKQSSELFVPGEESGQWPGAPCKRPDDAQMTADRADRARVCALAQIASADTHPLIVPRVRAYLDTELGIAEPERLKWVRHWFDQGSQAIEARLNEAGASRTAGPYAHGEQVTLADLALVSNVVGACLFPADLCLSQPAFQRAHPLVQQGAPAA